MSNVQRDNTEPAALNEAPTPSSTEPPPITPADAVGGSNGLPEASGETDGDFNIGDLETEVINVEDSSS